MGLLSKEAILKASDLPTEDVPVEEWGPGAVMRLRMLTAAERDQWESSIVGDGVGAKNTVNLRARLVCVCAVDADGKRLFADADAAALGAKSSEVLDRLFDAAMKLSKLRGKDVESEKNASAPAPSSGSSTGSASSLGAGLTPTTCLGN